MSRFTQFLVAAAVVAAVGLTANAASAHPPSVIVHPTVRPFPTFSPPIVRPAPYVAPYSVQYPSIYPIAPRHDHDYLVLTRSSPFGGWEVYGKFETRHAAEHAERRLEWRGIPARVVRTCDYNGW